MSTESIKKLVQFEKEAKEMLEEANKRYEDTKKQAREDAKEIIKIELENNNKKLVDLKCKVDEYIKLVENNQKEEFDKNVSDIYIGDAKDKLIKELISKVCKK